MVGRAPSPQYPHGELAAAKNSVQVRATWVLIAWKDPPIPNQTGKRGNLFSHFHTPVTVHLELKGPALHSHCCSAACREGDMTLYKVT